MSDKDWQGIAEQLALRGGRMQRERDTALAALDRVRAASSTYAAQSAERSRETARLRAALDRVRALCDQWNTYSETVDEFIDILRAALLDGPGE